MKEMTVKQAETTTEMTLGQVAKAAAKLFRNKYTGPMLVAWYDGKRGHAGPMEVCDGQPYKVALDYARSCGAETRISVNGGQYQLFFKRTPPDTDELDPSTCEEVHRDLEQDRFENMMGG